MTDAVPVFSAMLRTALAGRIRPDAASFVEMFAPDGVMEFPYGLPGFETIHGRDVLTARLQAQGDMLEFLEMSDPTVYEVDDGKTVVLEFVGTVRGVASGEVSQQKLVSIVTIEDQQIVHFVDYWNPLTLLGAIRGQEWLDAIITAGHQV